MSLFTDLAGVVHERVPAIWGAPAQTAEFLRHLCDRVEALEAEVKRLRGDTPQPPPSVEITGEGFAVPSVVVLDPPDWYKPE